jgi:uncharacterized damage-inducible protein DinB
MAFGFLVDTYETERLKTLSIWSQFREDDLDLRPEPRARTPLEHMVHQCVSEDGWMTRMLGIEIGWPPLPVPESRLNFLRHYAEATRRRLEQLRQRPAEWFEGETAFFDVRRSRAWVLVRRIAHSAHHRGQLTVYLRLLNQPLYSTYGPTADTGGLPASGPQVVYRYGTVEELLEAESHGPRAGPVLPGPGGNPPTERPR